MGLRLDIFKSDRGDCSNRGVSSRCSSVTLVADESGNAIDGPDEPSDEAPAVRLANGPYGSRRIVPVELEGRHTMFGGAFVWSSDSRFRGLSEQPVQLHDRVEG